MYRRVANEIEVYKCLVTLSIHINNSPNNNQILTLSVSIVRTNIFISGLSNKKGKVRALFILTAKVQSSKQTAFLHALCGLAAAYAACIA